MSVDQQLLKLTVILVILKNENEGKHIFMMPFVFPRFNLQHCYLNAIWDNYNNSSSILHETVIKLLS